LIRKVTDPVMAVVAAWVQVARTDVSGGVFDALWVKVCEELGRIGTLRVGCTAGISHD